MEPECKYSRWASCPLVVCNCSTKREQLTLGEAVEKPSADAPKRWRDMTPEEKGALLLAHHEGKVIEVYVDNEYWLPIKHGPHHWKWNAYRIKPEREMVEARLCIDARGTSLHMRPDFYRGEYGDDNFYFTLTFDIIDGKPDPASIKIEEL